MSRKYTILGVAIVMGLLLGPVWAGGFLTNGLPPAGGVQYPTTLPLTGNETLPADTNLAGGMSPQSESVTINQLAVGTAVVPQNFLTGGDFGTNLWQRGTSSGAVNGTLTYTADRWWEIGAASVTINISKQTGAADIVVGSAGSARFQRANGSAGVVPTCMGSTLTNGESIGLQGKKVEFSTYMQSGANFSPTSGNVSMIVGYGTGTDQSAASFQLGTWTGQVNTTQVVPITSTFAQYSVVANIPVTATQVGVEICWTPVGTASTNDWLEFSLAQLDINPGATPATGIAGVSSNIMPFFRRVPAEEIAREYRTAFVLSDSAAATARLGTCYTTTTTTITLCSVNFPVAMRAVPSVTVTTATSFGVLMSNTTATACTTLAAVTAGTTNLIGALSCTTGALTASLPGVFTGAATLATNLVTFSSDL